MPGAYELAVHGTWRGQSIVHTEQFKIVDAQSGEDAYIADRWGVNCSGAFLDIAPADYQIDRVTCRLLQRPGQSGPAPLERPYGNQGTRGAASSSYLPAYLCGVVTKRTDQASRRFRGRNFIPFLHEDDVTADGIGVDTVWHQRVQAYYDRVHQYFPHGDIEVNAYHCVFSHRAAALDPGNPGNWQQPVTGVVIRTGVHRLRSRTR